MCIQRRLELLLGSGSTTEATKSYTQAQQKKKKKKKKRGEKKEEDDSISMSNRNLERGTGNESGCCFTA